VDLNRTGVPCVNLKLDLGTLNQATNGAPVVLRQIEQ